MKCPVCENNCSILEGTAFISSSAWVYSIGLPDNLRNNTPTTLYISAIIDSNPFDERLFESKDREFVVGVEQPAKRKITYVQSGSHKSLEVEQ